MFTSLLFSACGSDAEDDDVLDKKAEQIEEELTPSLKIVNKSGIDFYGIMMSRSTKDTWKDVLTEKTFPNNKTITITFPNGKDGEWDIRLYEDENDIDNGFIEFLELDLTNISKLTIIEKNNKTWYSLE